MSKTLTIHDSGMSDEMQREFLQVAHQAGNKYTDDNDIVRYIKQRFDSKHGGYWHCDVGFSGNRVPHEQNTYIHFSLGNTRMTLFKSI